MKDLEDQNFNHYFRLSKTHQRTNFFNNTIEEVYNRTRQCGDLYYGEEFLEVNEIDEHFENLSKKKHMFTYTDRSVFTGLFSDFGLEILNCRDTDDEDEDDDIISQRCIEFL